MSPDPSCTDNLPVFPSPQGYPGNLPLEAQYLGNATELYFCDGLLALDTSYLQSHCPVFYSNSYGSLYKTAFSTFLTSATAAPAFTSANHVIFALNAANSFNAGASGFPIPSFTETGSLPAGLSFTDNGNGTATLSGTPTVAGVTTITLNAANSVSTTHQTFTITVQGGNVIGTGSGVGQFIYF